MKYLLPVIIFFISFITISFATKDHHRNLAGEQNGFALVELFTSEGCSSCPPADAIVDAVQRQYREKNVLIVGYHVDYWDKLGWKDIFSSPIFTERQEYYSTVFRLNSIYTPQLVVNGEKEFIGSNKDKLITAIDDELEKKPTLSIKLKANQNQEGKIEAIYSVDSNSSKKDKLILLLLQKAATNNIRRGENEGRTLQHINIVRRFAEFTTREKEEKVLFDIPAGLKKEDVFVAAFIQDKSSGKIKTLRSYTIE